MIADLAESRKKRGVTAMQNGPAFSFDSEAAKSAMQIGQKACAPVITRSQGHFDRPQLYPLPVIEFVNNLETEIMHQVADSNRHHDWLISRHLPQRATIEMIEVSMCNQHHIDIGKMMNLEPWLLQPFHHFQPFRPDGVD